ncbi:aminotransferase class IV [Methylocella sp.]|uniref:aminotransferase class IV n=1 Tax=Methylocella sp. TaxID=1978226 RepID=UPI00378429B5
MYWIDGATLDASRAPFDLADRGLTLGDGLFDTALALNGRVFRKEAHLARLEDGLALLGIDAPIARARACMDALEAHGARHSLRVTVTRGAGLRGLNPLGAQKPVVFGALTPYAAAPFPRLRLHLAPIRRNETSPASRVKALSYLDAILAMREAAAAGFDDALFLNGAGRVACAGVGNVFALFGDELATPPLDDGVLPGIMRALVLEQAPALGLVPRARSFGLDELLRADAAFMTNSLRLVAPIDAVGGTRLPERGRATLDALQALSRRLVEAECGAPL